ncbi:hypothetical protein [Sphingobium sp. SCG-1]|uniref:hypothetical protein n=1 Tax=Sphingobium sp. SCG-1 TaxID=2072936 RepID=UPI001670077A|nr:hypothetical protein [Sphingobium sp. SCG-1]
MIGSGYLAAGALALAAMTGAAGYFHGLDTGRSRERLASLQDVAKANAARDRLRGAIEQESIHHLSADQARRDTVREIIRESHQVTARPVYRNVCIDADGVRLLDRAQAAANGRDPGAPEGPASGAAEGAAER